MPVLGKKFIFAAVLILAAVIISLVILFFFYQKYNRLNSADTFVKEVRTETANLTGNGKTPPEVEKQLAIIENTSLPRNERSGALKTLAFYLSNEYSVNHDPAVRKFSSDVLGKYAKENFPEIYNETLFNFPCADSTCGQPIPNDIQTVLNMIDKSKTIPENVKITVTDNLTNAGYMTDKDEKLFGLELSLSQLFRTGDQEASAAAEALKNYIKKEYNLSDKDLSP